MPTNVRSPRFLAAAHRVGEAQVGVPDHAEHVRDTPVHHRLDHDVGDGARRVGFVLEADVDAVVAHLDREARRGVAETRRGSAGERVVVVPVPRAPEHALLDRALAEWSALVRAVVVERAVSVADARQREGAGAGGDGADPTVLQVVEFGDLVPLDRCGHLRGLVCRSCPDSATTRRSRYRRAPVIAPRGRPGRPPSARRVPAPGAPRRRRP